MTYIAISDDNRKRIKIKRTEGTSSTRQYVYDSSNAWVNLTGSSIVYRPPANFTAVVYEFNSVFGYSAKYVPNSLMLRLRIGDSTSSLGDVTSNNEKYIVSYGGTTGGVRANWSYPINLTFRIESSDWPVDSNGIIKEQTIMSQCKGYLAGYTANVNVTTPTHNVYLNYSPFIIVYSV